MSTSKQKCDECGSQYLHEQSKMASLYPNCAHFLYDYPNCTHEFRNGRCQKCNWNGTITNFVRSKMNQAEVNGFLSTIKKTLKIFRHLGFYYKKQLAIFAVRILEA